MNILQVALFGIANSLVAVASVFSIICVATDSWITYELGPIQGNLGLWRSCLELGDQDSECEDIESKLFIVK